VAETLRELGEREALERLRAMCAPGAGVVLGAGDDAALLDPPRDHLVAATGDAFVQGVHWNPAWMSSGHVGARIAAANLSDLAAMAARPRWALASYGLPEETSWEWLEGCQRGLVEAFAQAGAVVVGGNLTRTGAEPWIHVTLLGSVPAGAAWRRAGARPGDILAVTGEPGCAGAAARLVAARGNVARGYPRLLEAWVAPAARVREALAFAEVGPVRAAIDLSDGLSTDLADLCAAGGVGARLEEALLPAGSELEAAARELGVPLLELQLGPSDDYELLLAVDPDGWEPLVGAAESLGCPLERVGTVMDAGSGITLREMTGARSPLVARGWDHFRPRR
jgi:thiamine-monophosphate kinase